MQNLSLIENVNGKEVLYEVIATYHDDKSNKDFVVYTDKTLDEDKNLNIFYSLYCMDNNKIKLLPTENIEDKKIGLKIIKEVAEMLKNG